MLPLETNFIKNNNYLLKQNISGKGIIILHFWINRRQLDSHNCV